jgi:hypothetical protein
MRIFLGFLAGLFGLIVGWLGLAILVMAIFGYGSDGGIAMSAFFQLGPIGGIAGLIVAVLVFLKFSRSSRKQVETGPPSN